MYLLDDLSLFWVLQNFYAVNFSWKYIHKFIFFSFAYIVCKKSSRFEAVVFFSDLVYQYWAFSDRLDQILICLRPKGFLRLCGLKQFGFEQCEPNKFIFKPCEPRKTRFKPCGPKNHGFKQCGQKKSKLRPCEPKSSNFKPWGQKIWAQTVWTEGILFQTNLTKEIRFLTVWNKNRNQTVWTKSMFRPLRPDYGIFRMCRPNGFFSLCGLEESGFRPC